MDNEQIEPVDEPSPENLAASETDNTEDENALVSEQRIERDFYFENDTLEAVVALFTAESQSKLSSFLRKKVFIRFNSVSSGLYDEIEHDYSRLLMLNYRISPYDKYGLISFDFIFLHSVINLLYGGTISNNEPVMRGLGKSGIKIAKKVTEIFLNVLQDAMTEFLKAQVKMTDISNQLGAVFKQEKYDKCYNVSFCAHFDSVTCNLNIILPEKIFEHSEIGDIANAGMAAINNTEQLADAPIFDEKTRYELIDSHVTVSINLPNIPLKLRDVVNLKAGDIIPIGDPTTVFVKLNDKKLYKASAGQANQRRAVKITEKM